MASGCGNAFGRTSTSSAKRHVLHGARHRPDVSGVRGLDEHDANGGQRHGLYHSGPFRPAPPPMQPLLNIAVKAARRAGDIIVRAIPRLEAVEDPKQGPQRLRHRGRPRRRSRHHRDHPPPVSGPRLPRRGKRRSRATATSCGSSIRSMAPRISCTAFRRSPCPSPARSGAAWNTRWCSIPCARRCSPPRAAKARSRGPQDAREQADHARRLADRHRLSRTAPTAPWLDEYLAMLKAVMLKAAGPAPSRRRGAGPGLRRRRPRRWILGNGPEALGHGRGHAADHRGRRPRRHAHRRGLQAGRPHRSRGTPKVFAALVAELAPHVTDVGSSALNAVN